MERLSWKRKAEIIHNTVVKRWPAWSEEDCRFLSLAMAGEVGEFLNLVKKDWRGDTNAQNLGGWREKVEDEMADIRIYLELLAKAYKVNLDAACEKKIPILLKRWPEAVSPIEAEERSSYPPLKCVTGEDGND